MCILTRMLTVQSSTMHSMTELELREHHDFFAAGAKHTAVIDGKEHVVEVGQRWFRGHVGKQCTHVRV